MKLNELSKRVLTAAIGIPVLIFALIKGKYVFLLLVVLVGVVGLWEFFRIMELKGYKPAKTAGYISGIIIICSSYFLKDYSLAIFVVIIFILSAGLFEKDNKSALSGTGVTIFGVLYLAGLISFAIRLRNLSSFINARHITNQTDIYAVFFPIAIIFLSDTGAYFVGKAYGKNRVAPNISPKKSWEGVVGGILTSLLAGYIIWRIAPQILPLKHVLILSVILSIAGLGGDLAESRIKRDAEVKDSGSIFPGHGGVMDRVDALLFGLPITYIYLCWYFN
jgi:phosphatidate cytidylyltransferase